MENKEELEQLIGEFNAGQCDGLIANGTVTMSAQRQRQEAEYNCRDARKLALAVYALADKQGYMRGVKAMADAERSYMTSMAYNDEEQEGACEPIIEELIQYTNRTEDDLSQAHDAISKLKGV